MRHFGLGVTGLEIRLDTVEDLRRHRPVARVREPVADRADV